MIFFLIWVSLLFGLTDSNTIDWGRDFWFLVPISLVAIVMMAQDVSDWVDECEDEENEQNN